MATTPKPTARMRRILADIHNAGEPVPVSRFVEGVDRALYIAALNRKLVETYHLNDIALVRLTASGREVLGLPPQSAREPSPADAPRPSPDIEPSTAAATAEPAERRLLQHLADEVVRAVALRKTLTSEDWLELFGLAHEARELLAAQSNSQE